MPGPPINYHNGAPEFKSFREMDVLNRIVQANSLEENKFKTISEFKWCINDGGEVTFIWGDKEYGVFKHNYNKFIISEINNDSLEKCYNTADEVLEYMVGKDRLRDVITQVTVTDRTI